MSQDPSGIRLEYDPDVEEKDGRQRQGRPTPEPTGVNHQCECIDLDKSVLSPPSVEHQDEEQQRDPIQVNRDAPHGLVDPSASPSFGPSFKDQTRPVESRNKHRATSEVAAAVVPLSANTTSAGFGPDFKDQVRPEVEPQISDGKKIELEATDENDNGPQAVLEDGEPLIIDARYLVNTDNEPDNANGPVNNGEVYNADAFALTGRYFLLKRRCIIVLVALVLLVAAVVGGVCGSGVCRSSTTKYVAVPTAAPTTLAPTTMAPSSSPSSMPTVGSDSIAVVQFINNVTLSGKVLKYPISLDSGLATAEEKSLQWLIQKDPLQLSAEKESDKARLVQRYALVTLWHSLNGDAWVKNDGWLVAENECLWFGIECTNNQVTSITPPCKANLCDESFLAENNLSGTLPPDLALLQFVEHIDLSLNSEIVGSIPSSLANLHRLESFQAFECQLSGSLPDSIGAGWNAITYFDIDDNAFTGSLPPSLGNWTRLELFWADDNQFTGTIPDSFGAWAKILDVGLDENNFSGVLPASIGNWSEIFFLDISENNFSGPLPAELGSWEKIKYLWIFGNNFTGTLPSYNWSNIEEFEAHQNNLSGSLQESIGQWAEIKFFEISDNEFTGTLPETMSQWRTILSFVIGSNKFSGTLPDFFGSWTQLEAFVLQGNKFRGSIPESIGNWSNIFVVNLGENKLRGTLPDFIGAWTTLRAFNVTRNNFTGTLPTSIGEWTFLEFFSVSGCRSLTGSVPESVSQWQNIVQAYVNDTALVGSIPDELCQVVTLSNLAADCLSELQCSCCTDCY